MKDRLRWVAGGATILLLSLFFAVVFLPAEAIVSAVSHTLSQDGYALRVDRAGKVFPLGLRLRGVEISDARGPLLRFDDATVRLQLLPLLAGRATAAFHIRISGGKIEGEISGGKGKSRFIADRVPLDEIPFFATATGAAVRGLLSGRGELTGSGRELSGEIRAEATGAEITAVRIGGIQLPDASYERIQGMLRISGGKARLESLNLLGEGLYARLSGDATILSTPGASPLALTLELMPKPEFLEKQKLIFLLLARYLDSPGHYRIPVGGTLTSPALR